MSGWTHDEIVELQAERDILHKCVLDASIQKTRTEYSMCADDDGFGPSSDASFAEAYDIFIMQARLALKQLNVQPVKGSDNGD